MTKTILLVDVQHDRASFCIVEAGDKPYGVRGFLCDSQDEMILSLQLAIEDLGTTLDAAAFAAPGPVVEGAIQLTHAPLRLSKARLQEALGLHEIQLVNDFSARALAMPLLEDSNLEQVGGRRLSGQAPAAALGPGSGLGAAILTPDGFVGWVASAGEGGHACLPAINPRQSAVIEQLRSRDLHVSADRVLSDGGILEIAGAIAALEDTSCATTVALLLETAQAGDAVAREAFELFSQWLGVVAGDLALTAGARSGVYVFSPMILAWGEQFDRAVCRTCFETKGRMSAYVADIPLFLVTETECGLLGLSTLFNAA